MPASITQLYHRSVLLLCIMLVLLLTGGLTIVSSVQQKESMQRQLKIQAQIIASALTSKVEKKNEELEALISANPNLVLACVYREEEGKGPAIVNMAQGELARRYSTSPVTCSKLSSGFDDYLVARVPLMDAGLPKQVGEIALVATPPSIRQFLAVWLIAALLLSLLIAMCCWIVGRGLAHEILKPISHIARTAQRVSLYKDYSLRVNVGGLREAPTEIEALIQSFNAMLVEIEDRDSRLTRKSEELESARTVAEAASLAKTQFLANISHELRTPLNAIIGFSTMLRQEQFGPLGNEKYAEYARDIQDSGRHLLDVINDILDLTKAESGKLGVSFEALNITKIIEKSLHIIAGQAYQRRVDIYTDIPDDLPKIVADRVRLVQILLNLLSNAIKFTPEGGQVTLRVWVEEARNNVHYFTIQIEDTGIGMSEEALRKVFSSFNQEHAGLNRKYEGAGLGLPLTKKLVELHHGKIKLESTQGKGTTVTVQLTSNPALIV